MLKLHALGFLGTVMCLFCFAGVTWEFMAPSSFSYLALNLIGGGILVYYTLKLRAWASGLYNIIWVAIIAINIGRLLSIT